MISLSNFMEFPCFISGRERSQWAGEWQGKEQEYETVCIFACHKIIIRY